MKQQDKKQPDQEIQESPQVKDEIGKYVMHILGQPGDLLRVQVRALWDNRYRVNVLVGGDVTCAKIAHSYFLVADSGGAVIASTPKIIKQY